MNTQDKNTDRLSAFMTNYCATLERGMVIQKKIGRFLNQVIITGVVLLIIKLAFDL